MHTGAEVLGAPAAALLSRALTWILLSPVSATDGASTLSACRRLFVHTSVPFHKITTDYIKERTKKYINVLKVKRKNHLRHIIKFIIAKLDN